MEQAATSQFDFLYQHIQRILDENGFENLTEETRNQYLPQLVAEAERRLGVAVLPHLTEETAKELMQLVESGNATPEQMQTFWTNNIPDFEALIQKTLGEYAQEIKQIVSTL